jgi:hypothetical protein
MVKRVDRRLAAVAAADVPGLQPLIGLDEQGTLADPKAISRELIAGPSQPREAARLIARFNQAVHDYEIA